MVSTPDLATRYGVESTRPAAFRYTNRTESPAVAVYATLAERAFSGATRPAALRSTGAACATGGVIGPSEHELKSNDNADTATTLYCTDWVSMDTVRQQFSTAGRYCATTLR